MDQEELTGGFYNLVAERGRDQKWVHGIAVAVHDNAELLNAVVSRMNMIEAGSRLITEEVQKTTAKVEALSGDTRIGLDKVNDMTIERDGKLRNELDHMTRRLEEGHATLEGLLARVASFAETTAARTTTTTAPTTSVDQRDLGGLQEQLRFMGEKVDVQLARMGRMVEDHDARVAVTEMNASHTANVINEIQGAITAITLDRAQRAGETTGEGASRPDPWAGQKLGEYTTAAPWAPRLLHLQAHLAHLACPPLTLVLHRSVVVWQGGQERLEV